MFFRIVTALLIGTMVFAMSFAKAPKGLPMDIPSLKDPTITVDQLEENIWRLNPYIGSYPPKFKDDKEKAAVYSFWATQVSEAEALANIDPDSEKSYAQRSELYRQGHNMDVIGSADRAQENLILCFAKVKNPILCHRSAMYLYVSIGQEYLDSGEESILILREHYGDNPDQDVESHLILLHLLREDVESAKKEISNFLERFPNSRHVDLYKMIIDGRGEVSVRNIEGPQ